MLTLLTALLGLLAPELPPNATTVIEADADRLAVKIREGAEGSHEVVDGALRTTVTAVGRNPWSVEINSPLNEVAVAKDEYVVLSVTARTVEVDNEQQEAPIPYIAAQLNTEPWTPAVTTSAALPREWLTVTAVGQAGRDYAPGEMFVTLHAGAREQVIEVRDALVYTLPADTPRDELPAMQLTYPGIEPDAPWRAEAEARIDEHRKGELTVEVVNAAGEPAEGVEVNVAMTQHAFWWGTFIGDTPARVEEDPRRAKQLELALENFNYLTVPIYWEDWGWENPQAYERYMTTLAWARDTGLPFRAHVLVWPGETWLPQVALDVADDPEKLREVCMDHVEEAVKVVSAYGPHAYDVLNEPRANTLVEDVVGIEAHRSWFRRAKELDPDARMFINDYGILTAGGHNDANIEHYKTYVRDMLDAGVPLEGIGMQGHFGQGLTAPARAIEILDEFAEFGLPIHITEFDVETIEENGQATFTRDFMTAMFSHPSVEAFILWGFWEGDHWKPDGAMLREDFSAKPNFEVWRELIFDRWWTDETLTTDADGRASVRGFLGEYEVTVDGKTVPATLTRDGTTLKVQLAGD